MDNFREEIVVKKNRTLNSILYGVLMVLMVLFALIAAMLLSTLSAGINVVSIVAMVIFAGLAFLIFWKKDTLRTEYEYTFTNGELDFAKVLGNSKRKNLGSMRVKNVEACGHVAHTSFQRYITMPGVQKTNWFLNRDGNLFYFFYTKNNQAQGGKPVNAKDSGKRVIVIEPTEEMVALIKQYCSHGAYQG